MGISKLKMIKGGNGGIYSTALFTTCSKTRWIPLDQAPEIRAKRAFTG